MQQPLTKKRPEVPSNLSASDNISQPTSQYDDSRGDSSNLSASPALEMTSIFQSVQAQVGNLTKADRQRFTTHLLVVSVVILAITLSRYQLFDSRSFAIRSLAQLENPPVEGVTPQEEGRLLTLPSELKNLFNGVFRQAAVPHTTTVEDVAQATGESPAGPVGNTEIVTYQVESGDTIYGIAAKFGLSPETIMWSNEALENNPDLLSVGQELVILPVDGVYHQVGSGDTIEGIAATFKANASDVLSYPLNNLDAQNPVIQPGQWVIVPGGSKPFTPRTVTAYTGPVPEDATAGTGSFGWPASGSIFQGYWSAHPGIDIAAWAGAPVQAADSGYVLAAGWDNTGYGYAVVIDHGNGFQTLYGHLQAYYVDAGDNVVQGQQVGEMGSSGNSTGPHLHFEVRQGTVQRNPVGFLP